MNNNIKSKRITSFFSEHPSLGKIERFGPAKTQSIIDAYEVKCVEERYYLVSFTGDEISAVRKYVPPSEIGVYHHLW